MSCPKCGDPDYYEGVTKRDCPNPSCEMPGSKRKSVPPPRPKADDDDYQWSLPFDDADIECKLILVDDCNQMVELKYDRDSFVYMGTCDGSKSTIEIRVKGNLIHVPIKCGGN